MRRNLTRSISRASRKKDSEVHANPHRQWEKVSDCLSMGLSLVDEHVRGGQTLGARRQEGRDGDYSALPRQTRKLRSPPRVARSGRSADQPMASHTMIVTRQLGPMMRSRTVT